MFCQCGRGAYGLPPFFIVYLAILSSDSYRGPPPADDAFDHPIAIVRCFDFTGPCSRLRRKREEESVMRLLSLAGALVLGFVAQAQAADPAYKIVDRIKMPDGGWDYGSIDAAARKVYW